MTKSLPLLCFLCTGIPVLYGQTDQQLRDPEYLVEQYNQLVAKHNALIEKTRVIISDRSQASEVIETSDPRIQMKLNEALAKVSALETQLNRIKQEELRTNTSNQYLDDTNAIKTHLINSIPYFRYLMMGLGLLVVMRYRPMGLLPEKVLRK